MTTIGKMISKSLVNNRIDKTEVDALIAQAKKDGVVSGNETKELKSLLTNKGDKFDADAKAALAAFLGVSTNPTTPTKPTGPVAPPPPPAQPAVADPVILKKHEGQLTYNKVDGGQLFKDGVSYDDVVQGSIADCYFVGSLSAIAQSNPKAIEDCIKDNGDGTYTCRFFKVGWDGRAKAETVRIDGDVPTMAAGEACKYGKARDKQELWVSLIEKGYAAWKGGYEAIGNGGSSTDVLEAVTGKKSSYYSTDTAGESRMYDLIKKNTEAKIPVTAGTRGKEQEAIYAGTNLYAWHNYTVLGASEEGGKKFIQLRNPWGRVEPGSDGKDDGIFKVPVADFIKFYSGLNVGAPGYGG